ncbi:TetR/AcrR family transcriptional regulator [Pseudaestuariivita rosea]|uniref:TetR/AcrR family transcriptional regulator n=1 Tax=Pseudaestuariivita rosea TaxID=2763263 RepID=UPI001ABB2D2F|nr:TetR/AcrR family transcriptional regulator [Pseudaestuariivita rosea]
MTAENDKPPRRRRKDTRPAEIIEAGLIEFALNGYAGTKLTHVATRAGISKGTIYHYFPDKDALFRQAFRTRFIDSLADVEEFPSIPDGPVAPILRMALRIAYDELAQSDALGLLKIMLVEGDRFPELAKACRDDLLVKVAEPLRMLIQRGIAQGELADGAYQTIPAILFAPGVVIALTASMAENTTDGPDVFDTVLDVLMMGILKRP